MSEAGELRGIHDIGSGRLFIVKPYGLARYDKQTGQAPLSPLTAGVDTQAASVSFRLRYNYRPDSDLYVIYNEGTQFASIAPANPPQVRETRFAVKYTYSFAP